VISAGNDIVALNKVNKQRAGEFAFYSRILSTSEQKLHQLHQYSALPFEDYVWLLWSVKESAYKFLKRIYPGLIFSPTKIVVDDIEFCEEGFIIPGNQKLLKGKVSCDNSVLFFMSKINVEWIASVVNYNENFENICWEVERIEKEISVYQSNAARELLLRKLRPVLTGDLTIEKHPVGYLEILKNDQKVNIPVSIAHHGFFISCAFNLASLNENCLA
jgi:phosphopantetheinyl transferase (holo-ACP synthase)